MQASSTALPLVAPATAVSAARVPCRAPVATISVTIGPGVRNSSVVMSRKAENRCQFMGCYTLDVIIRASG